MGGVEVAGLWELLPGRGLGWAQGRVPDQPPAEQREVPGVQKRGGTLEIGVSPAHARIPVGLKTRIRNRILVLVARSIGAMGKRVPLDLTYPCPQISNPAPADAFLHYRTSKVRALRAAQLERLVRELVLGDREQDPGFVPAFLGTHRAFVPTSRLLGLLLPSPPPPGPALRCPALDTSRPPPAPGTPISPLGLPHTRVFI